MIPANKTWLANLGWKNGSLDHQNESSYVPWNEWTPAGNFTQPVNLTILPDNIAAIQFLVEDVSQRADVPNFGAKFALARTLLSNNYNSQPITCVYPISGFYGFLTRILFYLLLFFALLYRRHTWVAVAALGTAMTYSATTAIHALALLTQFGWMAGRRSMQSSKAHGDLDIYGTYPILLAAAVMFTPILNWSTNVRRDKAQTIMVLWGMLSFAALGPVMAYVSSTADGKMLHKWNPNTIPSLMLCPRSAAEHDTTCIPPIRLTVEGYTACGCFDFCGLLGPSAPMRDGSKMVPWLQARISIDSRNIKPFYIFELLSHIFATIIVCYGVLGLIHSYFSLREMRNLIFRCFYTRPKECSVLWKLSRTKNSVPELVDYNNEDNSTGLRNAQFVFAKTVATSYFLSGVLVAIVCPPILVIVIINMEVIGMGQWAYSEGSNTIGAWSSWVGAALVLVVTIILNYQDVWERFLLRSGERTLELLGFNGLEQRKSQTMAKPTNKSANVVSHIITCSIGGAFISIRTACIEFRDWVKAPPPHGTICNCEGCVFYRNLIRGTSTISNHAASCSCNNCSVYREGINKASKHHKPTCGCRLCGSIREEAQFRRQQANRRSCSYCIKKDGMANESVVDPTKILDTIEEKSYQSLGMRILNNLDRRVVDMLKVADTLPTALPSRHLLEEFPTVDITPLAPGDTSTVESANTGNLH